MIPDIKCFFPLVWVFFYFNILVTNVFSDFVDPFDMRNYDPVSKTMKRGHTFSGPGDLNQCQNCLLNCQNFVYEFCNSKSFDREEYQNEVIVKPSFESVLSRKEYLLQLHLIRFINILIEKSQIKPVSEYTVKETFLTLQLSNSHLKVLENFSESGDISLLQDISGILENQLNLYQPEVCQDDDDFVLPLMNVGSFFSRSSLLITAIVAVAAVFLYTIYVKRDILFAFVSLFSVIFFSGFFWTYWKLYEKRISDNLRISKDKPACEPQLITFLWFFSYSKSNFHSEACKDYYYATTGDPLSELTPTFVFYETIKVFWFGFFKDIVDIFVSIVVKLSENSPWYSKILVLPFMLVCATFIIVCILAFCFGIKFKLSNFMLGSFELGNKFSRDENPALDCKNVLQPKISAGDISKTIQNGGQGDGLHILSHSKMTCSSCGTESPLKLGNSDRLKIKKTALESNENQNEMIRNMSEQPTVSPQNSSTRGRYIQCNLQVKSAGNLLQSCELERSTESFERPFSNLQECNIRSILDRKYAANLHQSREFKRCTNSLERLLDNVDKCYIQSNSEKKTAGNLCQWSDLDRSIESVERPLDIVSKQTIEEPLGETVILPANKSLQNSSRTSSGKVSSSLSNNQKYFEKISLALSPDSKNGKYVPVFENHEVVNNENVHYIKSNSSKSPRRSRYLKNGSSYFEKCNNNMQTGVSRHWLSVQPSSNCSGNSLEGKKPCVIAMHETQFRVVNRKLSL